MGTRRQAREMAMQAAFFMDVSGDFSPARLKEYCRCFSPPERVLPFLERLMEGFLDHRGELDAIIERYSANWKVRRMACVDRNVLRLSVVELIYHPDIPSKVAINEAIDIAKKYGSAESGAFVNGILDSIRGALDRGELKPVTSPSPPPVEEE
jgi:transcription antitermination protein NusB